MRPAVGPGFDAFERASDAVARGNLKVFEEIGLDLVVIVLVAALSVVLLRRCGPRPLILYFAAAYVAGLLVMLVVCAA